jgi:hypothetical protein
MHFANMETSAILDMDLSSMMASLHFPNFSHSLLSSSRCYAPSYQSSKSSTWMMNILLIIVMRLMVHIS